MDFIFISDTAVHHDLFTPSQHHCPAENIGVVSINRKKNGLALCLTQESKKIGRAATIIGQCTGNYAHWLTESLAKIAILDAIPEFSEFPLLVDAGLHPNIYESLALINKNSRKIIVINRWEPVTVTKLLAVSHPAYERYVPHGVFSREAPPHVNAFSREALRLLKDAVCDAREVAPITTTRRIYLARGKASSNIRQIENIQEVEEAIRAKGVVSFTPELMTFAEQVAACKSAEIIVAPVGATLANMIFAPPGCKVVVLSPYYDEANYFYYTNLAGVLGHKLYYVLGPQTDQSLHPIHRNYSIDVAVLGETLDELLSG
jgi:capsular polysaccharide biosynthesis protein